MDRIALPLRMQGACIERDDVNKCWRLWMHTADWTHGTYLCMYDDGRCDRVTVRADEGDEIWTIKA